MRTFALMLLAVLAASPWWAGCSTARYVAQADAEAYGIIADKGPQVEDMPAHFTIAGDTAAGPLIAMATAIDATLTVSLADVLDIAVYHSREYQAQKERLYSQALSLSLARHRFNNIPFAGGSAALDGNGDKTLTAALATGVSRMLATGGDISVQLVTNLFRNLGGGDPGESALSTLGITLSQPLLRGAGRKVAREELTQAERDTIYAVRDYVRFRRTLSTGIAREYFAVLQQRDQLHNANNNYDRLTMELERSELMAQAGRLAEFQVDQTRQNALAARDRWIRTQEGYENRLDQFKMQLGLPTDVRLELQTEDLVRLARQGIQRPPWDEDSAVLVALERRLSLQTTLERYEDAMRSVGVREDALQAALNLGGSYHLDTGSGNQPANFAQGQGRYRINADLDLPLDRKAERNSYRLGLIAVDAARRALEQEEDEVKLAVRNALRRLDQAEKSHAIQVNSLLLAERRVESTALLMQAGEASSRDVLEAQAALLDAQNAVTSALVDHFNARLDLALATETLRIDEHGLWSPEYLAEPHP